MVTQSGKSNYYTNGNVKNSEVYGYESGKATYYGKEEYNENGQTTSAIAYLYDTSGNITTRAESNCISSDYPALKIENNQIKIQVSKDKTITVESGASAEIDKDGNITIINADTTRTKYDKDGNKIS